MKKRMLAFLLVLAMVLSAMPVMAETENSGGDTSGGPGIENNIDNDDPDKKTENDLDKKTDDDPDKKTDDDPDKKTDDDPDKKTDDDPDKKTDDDPDKKTDDDPNKTAGGQPLIPVQGMSLRAQFLPIQLDLTGSDYSISQVNDMDDLAEITKDEYNAQDQILEIEVTVNLSNETVIRDELLSQASGAGADQCMLTFTVDPGNVIAGDVQYAHLDWSDDSNPASAEVRRTWFRDNVFGKTKYERTESAVYPWLCYVEYWDSAEQKWELDMNSKTDGSTTVGEWLVTKTGVSSVADLKYNEHYRLAVFNGISQIIGLQTDTGSEAYVQISYKLEPQGKTVMTRKSINGIVGLSWYDTLEEAMAANETDITVLQDTVVDDSITIPDGTTVTVTTGKTLTVMGSITGAGNITGNAASAFELNISAPNIVTISQKFNETDKLQEVHASIELDEAKIKDQILAQKPGNTNEPAIMGMITMSVEPKNLPGTPPYFFGPDEWAPIKDYDVDAQKQWITDNRFELAGAPSNSNPTVWPWLCHVEYWDKTASKWKNNNYEQVKFTGTKSIGEWLVEKIQASDATVNTVDDLVYGENYRLAIFSEHALTFGWRGADNADPAVYAKFTYSLEPSASYPIKGSKMVGGVRQEYNYSTLEEALADDATDITITEDHLINDSIVVPSGTTITVEGNKTLTVMGSITGAGTVTGNAVSAFELKVTAPDIVTISQKFNETDKIQEVHASIKLDEAKIRSQLLAQKPGNPGEAATLGMFTISAKPENLVGTKPYYFGPDKWAPVDVYNADAQKQWIASEHFKASKPSNSNPTVWPWLCHVEYWDKTASAWKNNNQLSAETANGDKSIAEWLVEKIQASDATVTTADDLVYGENYRIAVYSTFALTYGWRGANDADPAVYAKFTYSLEPGTGAPILGSQTVGGIKSDYNYATLEKALEAGMTDITVTENHETADDITIPTGATVTVAAGKTLTINGRILSGFNNIILEPGAQVVYNTGVTVNYHAEGGNVIETKVYNLANLGQAMPTQAKTGYSFSGWQFRGNGSVSGIHTTMTLELLHALMDDGAAAITALPRFTMINNNTGNTNYDDDNEITPGYGGGRWTTSNNTQTGKEEVQLETGPIAMAGEWYDGAMAYAGQNKFFANVVGELTPDTIVNRAIITQLIYNVNNNPDPAGDSVFTDVTLEDWFGKAVVWAAEGKFIYGFDDGTFGPLKNVTREQMAVILRNYCVAKGVSLPVIRKSAEFADQDQIGEYAVGAVDLMYRAGILNGRTGNVFDPKGTATIAEVSTMFMNFLELIK